MTYATHDEAGDPAATNLIKPLYHVAWLGSRLGLRVSKPLAPVASPSTLRKAAARRPAGVSRAAGRPAPVVPAALGHAATLRDGRTEVAVVVRPVQSPMPAGTTLRVELLAARRGSELRADVTAEAEQVHVRVWLDGVETLERGFVAPRRTDDDLLAEAIESVGPDRVSHDAIRMAAALAGGPLTDSERPGRRSREDADAGADAGADAEGRGADLGAGA